MKITVCDRCGSQNEVGYTFVINGIMTTDFPEGIDLNRQYDLCKECAVHIATEFIESTTEN